MPYIGTHPTSGRFIELDSLSASATADYTLKLNTANYSPESVNNLLVSINGVIQGSSTMSLNGAVLTVGATLSSSDTIDFVRVFGNVGTVSTPTDGSVTANKIGSGAITNVKVADNAGIAGSKLGTNAVLQVKNVSSSAFTTGTTTIPLDTSIPQNTEGHEFLTLAFTPTSASSKLHIQVSGMWSSDSANVWTTVALFQDSTANAISASLAFGGTGTTGVNTGLSHFMTAGTTSEITFKVRSGANSASTTRMNGDAVNRYGGINSSSITITEIGG